MARKKADKKREVSGLIFLAIAFILAASFFLPVAKSGWLGVFIQLIGFGLFGQAAYALPVIALYMALDYLLEKNFQRTHRRFTVISLLFITVAVLFHLLTTDLTAIKREVADAARPAWQAIRLLWQSGKDPTLIFNTGHTISGGLVGGAIGLSLFEVAGSYGAVIITITAMLSLMIILFNFSLSGLFGRTAGAIQSTGQKVDRVVRERQEQKLEQIRQQTADPQSYNLVVEQSPESEPAPETEVAGVRPRRRITLLESLKKMFQPPAEELSEAENEPPELFDFPAATPNKPVRPVDLPAGVHRVFEDEGEVPPAAGDRSHWVDRSANWHSEAKQDQQQSRTQISLDIPYKPPPLKLLHPELIRSGANRNRYVQELGLKLETTLSSFGIEAHVVQVTTGPTITRFELSPGPGVKVSRIVSLSDDIALSLAALGVRIEAPIPGKSAIGVEIPNKETQLVVLRSLLESNEFKTNHAPLTAAIGRDIQGRPILCDLQKMPHLLIAGATGSGKSVCINAILMSILFRSSPEEVKMLMIDPKVVELNIYNGIPHLLAPVVTDPKKAANVLNWAVQEMVRRYELFAEHSVRDFNAYRSAAYNFVPNGDEDEAESWEKLPLILLVIDELSDLMATSPTEVEDSIARLTAMARAAGIHLIIATQRPSVDVITGVIKANIPSRIAFAVASQVDSRTILDMGGAEKLLGKGDFLFYPQSAGKPIRGQGAFVTDAEVEQVLSYVKNQQKAAYDSEVTDAIMTAKSDQAAETGTDVKDELFGKALEIVVQAGYGSVSLLQRRLNVGYPRAARLIDALHDNGYIGPFEGSKPRKLIITQAEYEEIRVEEDL